MKIENKILTIEVDSVDDILKIEKVKVKCGNFCGSFQQVVFCEECMSCRKEDDYEYWCEGRGLPAILVAPDESCSRGKRKPGKEET